MSNVSKDKKVRYRQVAEQMKAKKIQKDRSIFKLCRKGSEHWGEKAGIGKPTPAEESILESVPIATHVAQQIQGHPSILSSLVPNIRRESENRALNKTSPQREFDLKLKPKDILLKSEADKYKKRCIRNRESARISRLKKQKFVEDLQQKVKHQDVLTQWLKDLLKCQSENMAASDALVHLKTKCPQNFIEGDKQISSWQHLATLVQDIE